MPRTTSRRCSWRAAAPAVEIPASAVSIGVATLLGSTKASIGDDAVVNARGNRDAMTTFSGETVFSDTNTKPTGFLAKKTESAKGLAVTAYNRENLVTTVIGGAGGGTAGVAATVSAGVIATTTEASIGQGARINETNTAASADQQVRVKAVDETLLIDAAGAGAGGGSAGVSAAANVGVIAKTTTAKIGKKTTVKAKEGGRTRCRFVRRQRRRDFRRGRWWQRRCRRFRWPGSAWRIPRRPSSRMQRAPPMPRRSASPVAISRSAPTNSRPPGRPRGPVPAAVPPGVGVSLAVGVNASTTKAKIGDYAETNASGTTSVHADSVENLNTVTVAGAGGGSAGVAGTIAASVVVSHTEAGIGNRPRSTRTTVSRTPRNRWTSRQPIA